MNFALARRELSIHRKRSRDVGAIAAPFCAGIKTHQIAVTQHLVVGVIVQHGAVETTAGDRAERKFARATLVITSLHMPLQFKLIHVGPQVCECRRKTKTSDAPSLLNARHFSLAFAGAHGVQNGGSIIDGTIWNALRGAAENFKVATHGSVVRGQGHKQCQRLRALGRIQKLRWKHVGSKNSFNAGARAKFAANLRAKAIPLFALWIQRPEKKLHAPRGICILAIKQQGRAWFINKSGEVSEVRVCREWVVQICVRFASKHQAN